ncbi:MAG TPA: helix-turn-helix domain-containing protein [Thermoanaerobaculaceae bacterium]|nr:helix-turn-helix domain-containing protein [Thermoanaerobaculaceae bacterium]
MKIDKLLRKRKTDKSQPSTTPTQTRFPVSLDEFAERLDVIEREIKALRADTKFATQLAYTVEEAAQITRIGINELRERCGTPSGDPLHIKAVHIGRRIVIPRGELVRHLEQQAK